MSGAETALLGVGILCNAMQIITFGKDALHVYRNIRDTQSPDPKLGEYLKNAKAAFIEMTKGASAASQIRPLNVDQQQIIDIGNEVYNCMDELHRGFFKFYVDPTMKRGFQGKLLTLKKSAATMWRGKELKALEENLQRHERLLHGVQSVIKQLANGHSQISDLVIEASQTRNQIINEHATTRSSVLESIEQVRHGLANLSQIDQGEKQCEQLLQGLRFPEMKSRLNQIRRNHPKTFDWIFEASDSLSSKDRLLSEWHLGQDNIGLRVASEIYNSNSLPSWLESNSRLFWISGKPASGKSLLMKFLAFNASTMNHLSAWSSNIRILTHFFWKPGQLLQKNVMGMVLSLLYQVLVGKPDLARRLWETQTDIRHKRAYSDWSLDELSTALCWALKASDNAFCLFLDGLDEATDLQDLPYPDWKDVQVVHDLLNIKNLKICASSREEAAFCTFFAEVPRLRIHQLNRNDIAHFVDDRLDVSGFLPNDRNELLRHVLRQSQGVFLWVALVTDSLNREVRSGFCQLERLRERLQQTPTDLEELFLDMWGRMGDDGKLPSSQFTASRYFNLVITAKSLDTEWKSQYPIGYSRDFICTLLVIAIALEDESLESILTPGYSIDVGNLQAKCLRVENDIQVVCRGLLETISWESRGPINCVGGKELYGCHLERIDFIHRSVYDFFMETEIGHQSLRICNLSETDRIKKVLRGYLIKFRLLCFKRWGNNEIWNIDGMNFHRNLFINTDLEGAIQIAFNHHWNGEPLQGGILEDIRSWRLSGFFRKRSEWTSPQYFNSSLNFEELEFLELLIWKIEGNEHIVPYVTKLLDNYPIALLIRSVPVVLRGLSRVHNFYYKGMETPHKIIEHILQLLVPIGEE
ncbi:hypothetical protein F53441_14592 [Fusarium austroafricanum]|uniref:Nephrocystin 3-like N-terminal domain-containing protein n=1 Tax=Fusarium austroafricanum TaxID=2364996 RepID=A0A8H4JCH5_9HYPO|nr:hypothetical protein F53441_14592 [Fusarium austroafricanum]